MLVADFIAQYPPEPNCSAPRWFYDFETIEAGWAACTRPDWMLWIIGKVRSGGAGGTEAGGLRFARLRLAAQAIVILGEKTQQDTAMLAAVDAEGADESDSFALLIPHASRAFAAFRRVNATNEGRAALADFLRVRFNPFAS